ncbi:MAG: endonuclease/exonuclease/phosphatase family protein [Alphaproteobacteria bacterium]|nr:endonuclease/exonuclease/phosphatase family protein [Alphaproteobacteria bacterium]
MRRREAALRAAWSLLRRDRPPVPVGRADRDGAFLDEAPALRHVAAAIGGAHRWTAADLQARRPPLVAPPDPTAWLREMHGANPTPTADAVPLTVLTWNVALLDVKVFGRPHKASPYVDERRVPVLERALRAGADVVLLQEVWHAQDVGALRRLAADAGYRVACPERAHVDGLAVLLRDGIVAGGLDVEVRPYGSQVRLEALELPGKEQFLRSFLRVTWTHPELGRITVFDTHLRAYPEGWPARLQQSRTLGLEAARRPSDELVIVGGDLNAGAYYGRQTWQRPDGRIEYGWWANALSLPALCHHGGLVDLAIMGRPAADVDLEVRLGRTMRNDPDAAIVAPLDCDAAHQRAYTATDCNRLYFLQYAGTEQAARLDHLLVRDPTRRVHVARSRHRFMARDLELDAEAVEPSDHYGVEVDLRISR